MVSVLHAVLTAGQANASVAIANRLAVVGNSVLRWFLYTDSIAFIKLKKLSLTHLCPLDLPTPEYSIYGINVNVVMVGHVH